MARTMRWICGSLLIITVGVACGGGGEGPGTTVPPPDPEAENTPSPPTTDTPPVKSPTPDADGDGVTDTEDNCPTVANPDQANTDTATESARAGDACDGDDDGDGASDEEEGSLGADMVLTDPRDSDTDGDAVSDGADTCPLVATADQTDTDGDRFGDACDCQPANKAIHPAATDDPDITARDTNCDGIDGNRHFAIFVAADGNDANSGSHDAPVAGLARAVTLAVAKAAQVGRPIDVYLGAGMYDPTGVAWPTSIRLFGGFATLDATQPFGIRQPFDHVTVLAAARTPLLQFVAPVAAVTLDGVTLRSAATEAASTVLYVDGAKVTLRHSRIEGNPHALVATGVEAVGGAAVTAAASTIDPGGLDGVATTTGIWAEGGEMTLVNDLILGGAGSRTVGVAVSEGTRLTAVHNTIDGGSRGKRSLTATAVRFADAAPMLVNNILLTARADLDQVVVWCAQGSMEGVTIRNNLFAAFPGDRYHPLLVDCDGAFYFEPAAFPAAGEGLTANYDYGGMALEELVNVDAGYLLAVPKASYPVDAAATEAFAVDGDGIVRDLTGTPRQAPATIGAREQ